MSGYRKVTKEGRVRFSHALWTHEDLIKLAGFYVYVEFDDVWGFEASARPKGESRSPVIKLGKIITAAYEAITFKVKKAHRQDYSYKGVTIGRYSRPRGKSSLYNVEYGNEELSSGHETIGAACISVHEKFNLKLLKCNWYEDI